MYGLAVMLSISTRTTSKNIDKIFNLATTADLRCISGMIFLCSCNYETLAWNLIFFLSNSFSFFPFLDTIYRYRKEVALHYFCRDMHSIVMHCVGFLQILFVIFEDFDNGQIFYALSFALNICTVPFTGCPIQTAKRKLLF